MLEVKKTYKTMHPLLQSNYDFARKNIGLEGRRLGLTLLIRKNIWLL